MANVSIGMEMEPEVNIHYETFLYFVLQFYKLTYRASWKTEPQICGGILRATPQPQTLTSPGYPQDYPGGLECLYIIGAQVGRIITLEIEDLDLETNRDYILIRNGDNPKSQPVARLTGRAEDNPHLIMSTGSQLYLYFKTSLGDSRRGFRIKYLQGLYLCYICSFKSLRNSDITFASLR